jgi:hypothetical protein
VSSEIGGGYKHESFKLQWVDEATFECNNYRN